MILKLEKSNYRELLNCNTVEYSTIFKNLYRTIYTIGYKVDYKDNDLIGKVIHFEYSYHNYYGTIVSASRTRQTVSVEACTKEEYLNKIKIEKEAFCPSI